MASPSCTAAASCTIRARARRQHKRSCFRGRGQPPLTPEWGRAQQARHQPPYPSSALTSHCPTPSQLETTLRARVRGPAPSLVTHSQDYCHAYSIVTVLTTHTQTHTPVWRPTPHGAVVVLLARRCRRLWGPRSTPHQPQRQPTPGTPAPLPHLHVAVPPAQWDT